MEAIQDLFFSNITESSSISEESSSDLAVKVGEIYRHHLASHEKISLFENTGSPNAPGTMNFATIPYDLYTAALSIYHGFQVDDREEIFDATIRLLGVPINLISTIALIVLHTIKVGSTHASLLSTFTPLVTIAGVGLCILEGLGDAKSMQRQVSFERRFDFEILSQLKHMLIDFNPYEATKAVEKMSILLETDGGSLKEVFGQSQFNEIKQLIATIKTELQENPYQSKEVMNRHKEALGEVSRHILIKNFHAFQSKHLEMNLNEINTVIQEVYQKPDLNEAQQLSLVEKALEKEISLKEAYLSRRIRPWMAEKTTHMISPLLKGLTLGNEEALNEGLKLSDDIHTQLEKKRLAHLFGLAALVCAAVSLILLAAGCPLAIPLIFTGLALVLSFARAGIYTGMLEQRGWTFDAKQFVPEFLRKHLFTIEDPEKINEKFYEKTIRGLDQEYSKITHIYQLNRKKMSPSLPPSHTSSESPESLRTAHLFFPVQQARQ